MSGLNVFKETEHLLTMNIQTSILPQHYTKNNNVVWNVIVDHRQTTDNFCHFVTRIKQKDCCKVCAMTAERQTETASHECLQ